MAAVSAADLHKAVATAWANADLDDKFNDAWSATERARFTALNDGGAAPGQPFPYCVFEIGPAAVTSRMSGGASGRKREIRDTPVQFTVYTSLISGDGRSAKQIAADLADRVLRVFGGHPTARPTSPPLANGRLLLLQYQTDFGRREGDDEYSWTISYQARADVPVAVPP